MIAWVSVAMKNDKFDLSRIDGMEVPLISRVKSLLTEKSGTVYMVILIVVGDSRTPSKKVSES